MGSYFDAQPHSKTTAELAGLHGVDSELGNTGLLSPQVTRILDDLEEHSSSDEEVSSHSNSGEESAGRREGKREDKEPGPLRKAQTSPLPHGSKKEASLAPPPRPGLSGALKHPRLGRFYSLRSMLFSSHIEDNIAKCKEAQAQAAAEEKWKEEYEQRRGLNRPKTPESPEGSPTKEGFTHRIGDKIKRMAGKDIPVMKGIEEDDNQSTASDEEDVHPGNIETGKKWDERLVSDDESINPSDVEELARWVSRRDPPSDGEDRRGRKKHKEAILKEVGSHNSGHGSLGNDDVDELVRWVTRKDEPREEEEEERSRLPSDYSEASTESDSEGEGQKPRDLGEEDVDELVRWVSRREGLKAGPVRGNHEEPQANLSPPAANDSGNAELARWVTRQDDTSGESDVEALPRARRSDVGREREHGSLDQKDVDDLVRWVSRKDDTEVKDPEGAPEKETLTHGDIDELVRWISRREEDPQQESKRDDDILKWKQEEDAKRAMVGMSQDAGSLRNEDVDELVRWVSRKK